MSLPPRPTSLPAPAPAAARAPLLDRVFAAIASWSPRREQAPDSVFEEFAESVAAATDPGAVAPALARLAHRLAGPGAVRAEVWRDDRRVAAWPAPAEAGRGSGTPRTWGAAPIELPLRCGGRPGGTLRIVRDSSAPIAPHRRRRLAALAALAAAAESALAPAEPAPAPIVEASHPTHDPATGLPNATFLEAFLGYALALADRRDESVTLLYIAVDRLAAIRGLHGPAVASEAVRRVGRTVAGALRRSDLIARIDDGRLAAVLPGASADDGRRIAEHVRSAVAQAGAATPTMPVLTASIGVASFPADAGDAVALRSAAAAALAEARARGRDLVAAAPPIHLAEPPTMLRIAQHAG